MVVLGCSAQSSYDVAVLSTSNHTQPDFTVAQQTCDDSQPDFKVAQHTSGEAQSGFNPEQQICNDDQLVDKVAKQICNDTQPVIKGAQHDFTQSGFEVAHQTSNDISPDFKVAQQACDNTQLGFKVAQHTSGDNHLGVTEAPQTFDDVSCMGDTSFQTSPSNHCSSSLVQRKSQNPADDDHDGFDHFKLKIMLHILQTDEEKIIEVQ